MAMSATFQWVATALSKTLGVEVTGVVYKGAGEFLPALLGNHVDLAFWAGGTEQYERSGTVRVLGTFSSEHIPGSPHIVTFKKSGVPIELALHFVLMVPKTLNEGASRCVSPVGASRLDHVSPLLEVLLEGHLPAPARVEPPASRCSRDSSRLRARPPRCECHGQAGEHCQRQVLGRLGWRSCSSPGAKEGRVP